MADSQSNQGGGKNPNRIFDMNSLAGLGENKVPTTEDKVYRAVSRQDAIEDIHRSGVVRNAHDAGVKQGKNRWGNSVYWTRGKKGMNNSLQGDGGFMIEAPHSVASQRQVRAEDITGVYQRRNGRVSNILNEKPSGNVVRRSRGFLGRPNSNVKEPVKYRIGYLVAGFLMFVAFQCDVWEFALDSIGTAGFGVFVVIGYLKDAFAFVFFPLMFFIFGVPFWKGRKAKKKMIAMVTGYIVGAIPWAGAFLPETLIAVTVTIYLTRAEDKGLNEEQTERFVKSKTVTRIKRASR